jgi:hypothetical protein
MEGCSPANVVSSNAMDGGSRLLDAGARLL